MNRFHTSKQQIYTNGLFLLMVLLCVGSIACGDSEKCAVTYDIQQGDVFLDQGNYEDALNHYNKAIKCDPTIFTAYLSRAEIYMKTENYELALTDYNKVIELNPFNPDAYVNRAAIYTYQENYSKAIEEYSLVLKLWPHEAGIVYSGRGVAYFMSNEYSLAVNDLTAAIDVYPNDPYPYYYRGYSYLGLEKNVEAVEDLETALSLTNDPEWVELINAKLSELKDQTH